MRKLFPLTALLITVCSLATIATVFSATCSVQKDVCNAVEEEAEKIERIDGNMLWESLSSQFVSSVRY
jgi:hypothetical protein